MMTARRNLVVVAVLGLVLLALAAIPVAQARHRKHHGALPYMGRQPRPSLFGIDTDTFDSNHAYWARDIPTASRLGARFDHFVLGPKTGSGNFAEPDYVITQARRHGLGVVLSFEGIAAACSKGSRSTNVKRCPPTSTTDLRRYQAYVRRVLLRYRRVVTYYESWVEINHDTSLLTASQYATLLKTEYAVFQSVNRQYHLHLQLLFGSTMGFSVIPGSRWVAVLPFTDRVLNDLRGAQPFDGIALHGYRFPPATEGPSQRACDYVAGVSVSFGISTSDCPSPMWRELTWSDELQAYEQEFARHGYGQQPLWLLEFGWPGNAAANGSYFPSDDDQASALRKAYADLLHLPFVQAALWFNFRDYQPGINTGDPAFFYHYGLVNYGFGQKPAASAFEALAAANPGR